MKTDITTLTGSATNLIVDSGTTMPLIGTEGTMFLLTAQDGGNAPGIYIHDGTSFVNAPYTVSALLQFVTTGAPSQLLFDNDDTFIRHTEPGTSVKTRGSKTTDYLGTGLQYWEAYISQQSGIFAIEIGLIRSDNPMGPSNSPFHITSSGYNGFTVRSDGYMYLNNSNVFGDLANFGAGATIRFAYNSTNGRIWVGDSTRWTFNGNPATGTNPTATLSTGHQHFPAVKLASSNNNSYSVQMNFRSSEWIYTPPAGFNEINA